MKRIVPKLSSNLSKMWNKILNLEKKTRVNYLYGLKMQDMMQILLT